MTKTITLTGDVINASAVSVHSRVGGPVLYTRYTFDVKDGTVTEAPDPNSQTKPEYTESVEVLAGFRPDGSGIVFRLPLAQ